METGKADILGRGWVILSEAPKDEETVDLLIQQAGGGQRVSVTAPGDWKEFGPLGWWDVVDPRTPREKVEELVDNDDAETLRAIFPVDGQVAPAYADALNQHGRDGWTALFRAILLRRSVNTIEALVLGGADITQAQRWDAVPYVSWTPVTLAVANHDAARLKALLANPKTPPKIVFSVEATILAMHRTSAAVSAPLIEAVRSSEAYRAADKRPGAGALRAVAKVGTTSYSQMFLLTLVGDSTAAVQLLRAGDNDIQCAAGSLFRGWTALQAAVVRGDEKLVQVYVRTAEPDDLARSENALRAVKPLVPRDYPYDRLAKALEEEKARRADDQGPTTRQTTPII